MVEKAIARIRAEMNQKPSAYIQVIGNFLIKHIQNNPEDAAKIATTEKTIEKSLDEMRKEAEKKKVGNCAVLTDDEGFSIVLKYFGLRQQVGAPNDPPSKLEYVEPITSKQPDKAFSISLDDLL